MAKAIQKAKYLIVYTGAGISTAANIPDYRGPNGVWTCLDEGRAIPNCALAQAEPTYTHMALFTLFKKGKMKHIGMWSLTFKKKLTLVIFSGVKI